MDNIKTILEIVYFFSGTIVCVTAIIMLKQLGISRDALKRDALRITAEQCENYNKVIVPLHLELNNKIEKNNIKFFDDWKIEIENNSILFTHEPSTVKNDTQPVIDIIITTLDAMETFSNYFIFKLADEKAAYGSVSSSFIAVIEKLMPLVAHFTKFGHYRNIVSLFVIWKSRNDRQLLLNDKENIDEKLSKIPNSFIIPI